MSPNEIKLPLLRKNAHIWAANIRVGKYGGNINFVL